MRRIVASFIALGSLALGVLPALADSPAPIHLRGEIAQVSPQSFAFKPTGGAETTIAWNDATKFASLRAAQLTDIKSGLFVGTAAIPQADGTLKALEIHIFPESMRGTGEGYKPFPQVPQGTMTNATVTDMVGSGTTSGDGGRTLTLTYNDGKQTVIVPKNAPIVLLGPGDATMLQSHAKASVTATKDANGKLTATRILIGLDGATPPI